MGGSQPQVLILGPVAVVADEQLAHVGGRQARLVLALLAIAANHAVSFDLLMDALWGDQSPPSARNTLQSHVSRLRRLLGKRAITREDHAYVLDIPPEHIDACRFERLSLQATDTVSLDPARAQVLCRQALSLWRGPPFGDLAEEDFIMPEAQRLEELRVSVTAVHFEADLALGHYGHSIAALQGAARDHPYNERLWYLLVGALASDGRRAEALRTCQALRDRLADLGLEPCLEFQELEDRIHRQDPSLRTHFALPRRAHQRKSSPEAA